MSVRVIYRGAFGNNLFQYICARLFAEENGLRMETPWRAALVDGSTFDHEDAVYMRPQLGGDVCDGPEIPVGDDSGALDRKWPKGRYVLDGYFQNAKWYYDRRDKILSFARPRLVRPRPPSELVANVRLGDYVTVKKVIHPDWYHSLLSRLKFDHLHIVTDCPNFPYFDEFKERYGATIANNDVVGDFNMIREFGRIICANGTFSWWAAFFSVALEFYTFKRWLDDPRAELSSFPGAEPIDGRFIHEV
jgi:hypothetical protein